MDIINDKQEIKKGFAHNLPLIIKIDNQTQDFFASVLNPTQDYLLITPIISSDALQVEIPEGERIEVALKYEGMLWSGFSIIVEVIKGDFEGIWLTYPNFLQKVQRRNFLRLKFTFPISIKVYEKGEKICEYKGFCQDLSGSGISVMLDTPLRLQDEQFAIMSFVYKSLTVDCKVAPVYHIRKGRMVKMGFRFVDIDREFSENIHKFIIKEQIKRKREGFLE